MLADGAVNASGKTCWLLVETGHDGLVPIQYGEGAAAESEAGTEDWDIGSSAGANEAAGRDCEAKASRVAIAWESGRISDRSSMFRWCYYGGVLYGHRHVGLNNKYTSTQHGWSLRSRACNRTGGIKG